MHRGSWKSSYFPRIEGVQWSSIVVSSLVLRRSRRRPASPSRRCGRCCGVYSPPGVAWWRSVGPVGQGLAYICAPAMMGRVVVPDPPWAER